MIIGHSVYNVPALAYLLETKIFSIVEYQLKCGSVADNAAPECYMVCSGAMCCRQGHQWVAWTAAHLCESWWTTLWTFALSRKLLILTDFTVLLCWRALHDWHALKLLLALLGIVITCKARFGGLSDVKISLQNSSDMCLLKIIKFRWHLVNLLQTVKGPLFKTMQTQVSRS